MFWWSYRNRVGRHPPFRTLQNGVICTHVGYNRVTKFIPYWSYVRMRDYFRGRGVDTHSFLLCRWFRCLQYFQFVCGYSVNLAFLMSFCHAIHLLPLVIVRVLFRSFTSLRVGRFRIPRYKIFPILIFHEGNLGHWTFVSGGVAVILRLLGQSI